MATKTFTQRDVAKLAGVSYPTVNRALSGSERVSPKLRAHILEVAQSVGYRKNLAARNLTTRRTQAIGLVSLHLFHSYWGGVFRALEQAARADGYHVVACHRDADADATSTSEISFLLERQVDGLIVVPNSLREDTAIFNTVANEGVPLLFLDERFTGAPGHYLGSQNREGAREACQYLLDLGHRRIVFVTAPQGYHAARDRKEGYVDAMRASGLRVTDEMVITTAGWGYQDADAAVQQILAMDPRPTAIFAANDPLAINISLGMRRAGVAMPTEMSLMGFAGMEEGAFLSPPLTTMAQPSAELGRRAAELMVELIDGKHEKPVYEELPNKLLIRESCVAPPSP